MPEEITQVESGGGGSNFSSGLIIGVIVVILIIIGVMMLWGRGAAPAPQAAPESGGDANIEVPSQLDINLNVPNGGGTAPKPPGQ